MRPLLCNMVTVHCPPRVQLLNYVEVSHAAPFASLCIWCFRHSVHVRSFSKFPKLMNTCYLRLRLTHLHNYICFPEELKWNHGLGMMTKPGKTGLLAGAVALSTADWCITGPPNSQML